MVALGGYFQNTEYSPHAESFSNNNRQMSVLCTYPMKRKVKCLYIKTGRTGDAIHIMSQYLQFPRETVRQKCGEERLPKGPLSIQTHDMQHYLQESVNLCHLILKTVDH